MAAQHMKLSWHVLLILISTGFSRVTALQAQGTVIEGTSTSWSPDSLYVVVGDQDGRVSIWEIATEVVVYRFDQHESPVHSVTWSPTGDAIASGDANGTIQVWEPFTGEILVTLTGHTDTVNTLDWNPTGRMLVSGSDDGTLRVWDVEQANEITSFASTGPVTAADWSPDGTQIAYGGIDETKQGGVYDVIQAPVLVGLRAHAGADQTVETSDGATVTVTLDGSWSQATVGDIASYAWRENGEVVGTGVHPELTLEPGTHIIELTIFNDYARSDTDEVVIRVLDNSISTTAAPESK
jgi:WD40 repeat protein